VHLRGNARTGFGSGDISRGRFVERLEIAGSMSGNRVSDLKDSKALLEELSIAQASSR